MTNFRKIKNMNLIELAEFLDKIKNSDAISNEVCNKLCKHSTNCEAEQCVYIHDSDMFELWLQQEAK